MKEHPHPYDFTGRNALIVGAGAIGDAVALRLIEHGANAIGVTKSTQSRVGPYLAELRAKAESAGLELPKHLFGFGLDLSDRQSITSGVTQAASLIEREGGIDLIVITSGGVNKTAGQTKRTKADEPAPSTPADREARQAAAAIWTQRAAEMRTERMRTYDINVTGPMQFLDELAPRLLEQDDPCCVVTICSAAPELLMSGIEPYSEAKAALLAGTQSWGVAVGKERVRLGLPAHRAVPLVWGWSIGEQNRKMLFSPDGKPTWRFGAILDRHPGSQVGTVDQAAEAIMWVANQPYVNIDPFIIAGGGISYAGI